MEFGVITAPRAAQHQAASPFMSMYCGLISRCWSERRKPSLPAKPEAQPCLLLLLLWSQLKASLGGSVFNSVQNFSAQQSTAPWKKYYHLITNSKQYKKTLTVQEAEIWLTTLGNCSPIVFSGPKGSPSNSAPWLMHRDVTATQAFSRHTSLQGEKQLPIPPESTWGVGSAVLGNECTAQGKLLAKSPKAEG